MARARETPRGLRASLNALRSDLGRVPTTIGVVAIVAIPLAALVLGAVRTRSHYVTASELHASVEALLVVIALVSARRREAFANREGAARDRCTKTRSGDPREDRRSLVLLVNVGQ